MDKYIAQELEKNEGLETEESEGEERILPLPDGPILRSGSFISEEEGTSNSEALPFLKEESEDYYGPYNFSPNQTLYESLLEQLSALDLTPAERRIAEYLIGNLDERGYLTEPLGRLARLFSMDTEQGFPVSEEEMEAVLKKLQTLEPPGIAARSLQESLYLQAQALPADDFYKPYLLRLFGEDFHLLAQRRLDKLRAAYGLSEEEWAQLMERLRGFSLAPGAVLSEETAPQVQPDFVLHIDSDGSLRVELTRWYSPRLRVSAAYREFLEKHSRKEVKGELSEVLRHVKERVERAEQFIQLLKQREQTLLRTAEEIVRHQRMFFLHGCDERQLRPLVLRQIAEAIKVDISTVSRVVSSKYIETPCGIFPLKFFFSEGLRAEDGKNISNKAVKRLLRDLIAQESPESPLSDEKLTELLQARGIQIKRRTVAKYREQLGIPSARERKRIS